MVVFAGVIRGGMVGMFSVIDSLSARIGEGSDDVQGGTTP